jgi:hypothetical protein
MPVQDFALPLQDVLQSWFPFPIIKAHGQSTHPLYENLIDLLVSGWMETTDSSPILA